LVRVSERLRLLPVCTLPKLRLEGRAPSEPGATAVAESGMARVATLLVIEREPLALPAAEGAKLTLKLELWPGPRVRGRLRPTVVNEPVTFA